MFFVSRPVAVLVLVPVGLWTVDCLAVVVLIVVWLCSLVYYLIPHHHKNYKNRSTNKTITNPAEFAVAVLAVS